MYRAIFECYAATGRQREKKRRDYKTFFPAPQGEGRDKSNLELKSFRNLGTTLLLNFTLNFMAKCPITQFSDADVEETLCCCSYIKAVRGSDICTLTETALQVLVVAF